MPFKLPNSLIWNKRWTNVHHKNQNFRSLLNFNETCLWWWDAIHSRFGLACYIFTFIKTELKKRTMDAHYGYFFRIVSNVTQNKWKAKLYFTFFFQFQKDDLVTFSVTQGCDSMQSMNFVIRCTSCSTVLKHHVRVFCRNIPPFRVGY